MLEFNLGDIITIGALAFAGVLTFVEISPIKWNPWTAIGKLINRATLDELKEQKTETQGWMKDMNNRIQDLCDRMDESEAKAARMRIQRFADEMYGEIRHSKEHFDLILMDITAYNRYCDEHPGFIYEKTRVAQDVITETYEVCLRERKFRG